MRIRSVKPDFFKDEDLADLPALTRLLFIGLWCLADGEGRLEYRPKYIKIEVLPYAECDIEIMLDELMGKQRGNNGETTEKKKKFIKKYEFNGREYLVIPNFSKHQRITGKEAKTKSKYPPPPSTEKEFNVGSRETIEKQSGNNREGLDAQERKGKERKEKKRRGGEPAAHDAAPPQDSFASQAGEGEPVQLEVVPSEPVQPPDTISHFINRWGEVYTSKTGEPFKSDAKSHALVKALLKIPGVTMDTVIRKSETLAHLCENQKWPGKSGWADFTFGNLSANFNSILETVQKNGKGNFYSSLAGMAKEKIHVNAVMVGR